MTSPSRPAQVKEQKEEAERFKQKQQELEDLRTESYLVQLFHIDKASAPARPPARLGASSSSQREGGHSRFAPALPSPREERVMRALFGVRGTS